MVRLLRGSGRRATLERMLAVGSATLWAHHRLERQSPFLTRLMDDPTLLIFGGLPRFSRCNSAANRAGHGSVGVRGTQTAAALRSIRGSGRFRPLLRDRVRRVGNSNLRKSEDQSSQSRTDAHARLTFGGAAQRRRQTQQARVRWTRGKLSFLLV